MKTGAIVDNKMGAETEAAQAGSVKRIVRRRRIRAELATAAALDETLCRIQDAGGTVYNIIPFHGSMNGQQHDVGDGKSNLGMTLEPSFAITYGEAS